MSDLLHCLAAISKPMSESGTKRTSRDVRSLVAIGGKADMAVASAASSAFDPERTPDPFEHIDALTQCKTPNSVIETHS